MAESTASTVAAERARAPRLGLSVKLLVLTVLFVMMAEVLIYVPSVANFRLNWLQDRISSAYTAALVLEATPNVPETLTKQILDSWGEDGWELVAVVPGPNSEQLVAYLKRPKAEG